MKLCACGCGEEIKPKNKYKNRSHATIHLNRTRVWSVEAKLRHSIVTKEYRKNNPDKAKEYIDNLQNWIKINGSPNKGKQATIEIKEKQSNSRKNYIENNPDKEKERLEKLRDHIKLYGSSMKGKKQSEEAIEKIRIAALERIRSNPNYQKAESNSNWNGGSSFEPYDERFNEDFKTHIRARQNYECADKELGNCNLRNFELAVHHIDRNKKHSTDDNCIALCHYHHSKAHNETARVRHREFVKGLMQ